MGFQKVKKEVFDILGFIFYNISNDYFKIIFYFLIFFSSMRNKNKEKEVKYFLLGAGLTLLVMTVVPASARYIAQMPPPSGGGSSFGGGTGGGTGGTTLTPSFGGTTTQPSAPSGGTTSTVGPQGAQQGIQLQQSGTFGGTGQQTPSNTSTTLTPAVGTGLQQLQQAGQTGIQTRQPAGGETGSETGQFPGGGATEGKFPGQGGKDFSGKGKGVGGTPPGASKSGKTREDFGPPSDEEGSSEERSSGRFSGGKQKGKFSGEMPEPPQSEGKYGKGKSTFGGGEGDGTGLPSEGKFTKPSKDYFEFESTEESRFTAPKKPVKQKDIFVIPELDFQEADYSSQLEDINDLVGRVTKLRSKDKILANFVAIAQSLETICEESGLDCGEALDDAAAILDSRRAKAKDYKKALKRLVDTVIELNEAAIEEAEIESEELE